MLILQPLAGLRIVRQPIQLPLMPPLCNSLENLRDSGVNPRVVEALCDISQQLTDAGVRHAVIGALAVGVYGWPRATKDIDLLVGDEAWDRQPSGQLLPRVPLPEKVQGVPVDYLPLDVAGDFLQVAWSRPFLTQGVPIAPPEVVVCTKLIRLAMRDQADIVEVVKAGIVSREAIGEFLAEHTPMLVGRWNALVQQADEELTRG